MVAETPLPQGTFTSLEGTFQAEEQAARTIGLLSLISVAAVFIVLYGRYRSAALTLIEGPEGADGETAHKEQDRTVEKRFMQECGQGVCRLGL